MRLQVSTTFTAGSCKLRATARALDKEGYLAAWGDVYTIARRHPAERGESDDEAEAAGAVQHEGAVSCPLPTFG